MKIILEGSAAEILDLIFEMQDRTIEEYEADYDGACQKAMSSCRYPFSAFKKMAHDGKLGYSENSGDLKESDNKEDEPDSYIDLGYITDSKSNELIRKCMIDSARKIAKLRSGKVESKVYYNGIKINGLFYTFGNPEDIWKYVGSTVNISKNRVYSLDGKFLGHINCP